jgi:murein DD-endopeptidase MepM/ murein hydrolase activator NlpD
MRQLRALIVVVLLAGCGSAAAGGYTVRWGDTLSGIGKRFGVAPSSIASANGIANADYIIAGSVLVVPQGKGGATPSGAPASGVFHVVKAGETLATIARRFGTTQSAIAAANGLSNPNLIREGQRLVVPGQQWLCPVKGYTTPVHNWQSPRPGGRRHQGNDLFAARGTPVIAPVGGTLRHVRGNTAGYAFYLAGDDGTTYYGAHMDSYVSSPGRVSAGTVIGRVGSTGNAAGLDPHLHFEVHPNGGAAVDPWPLLSRAC